LAEHVLDGVLINSASLWPTLPAPIRSGEADAGEGR
jgi:hypothetical protein